jgi:hypothetical protein
MRGLHPIVMDAIQNEMPGVSAKWNNRHNPFWPPARLAMGYTLHYAKRMNLVRMVPRNDLASTRYCLANPGAEYIIYLPFSRTIMGRGRKPLRWLSEFSNNNKILLKIGQFISLNEAVTVDLSQASGQLNVEWFNPNTGKTIEAGAVVGGAIKGFSAPFNGDAVLYLYKN